MIVETFPVGMLQCNYTVLGDPAPKETIVVDPGADVYHDYEFGRHSTKLALLERNREIFVLTAYSPRLMLLLSPLLAATELGMLALAAKQRWLGGKLGGWWWLARHPGWLGRHRAETGRLRRVPDRDLAAFLTPSLDPATLALGIALFDELRHDLSRECLV